MTARITPYELVLEPLEITAFPAIRAEAEQRGRDTRRRDQFVLLGHVGATLKEIVPDDAPPDSLEEFAELLYHGFQFWSFGRRLYTFDPEVVDLLTAPHASLEDWRLAGCPSCYLQLPEQRIWARVSVDAPYEPADGIFVVVDDTEPAPETGVHLRAQLVLGMRPDRAGLSLVSYRTDLDPRSAPALAEHPWRENDAPFADLTPGSARHGHLTLATTSELQALVIRALHHIDRNTDQLIAESGSAADGESKLPHLRVVRGA
ncbi:MAG TPA: hypothetical protein VJ803_03905 [Gemmatimonadaceae bacterium]|nr:hypothetical protein [Gemmatimonadaceae bacterium]